MRRRARRTRRACQVLGLDRSKVRYRSLRPDDGAVRLRLRALAAERRRFGYRRLHVLLQREGVVMNQKRFRRLYCGNGCTCASAVVASGRSGCGRRSPFRRAQTSAGAWTTCRTALRTAPVPGSRGGRRCTRECLALVADTSLSARVARELDAVIAMRGKPVTCVSDNGTELTSMAILAWSRATGVG